MEQTKISHPEEYYENIFNMYKDKNENDDMYYFYNIGKKITLPKNIDDGVFDYFNVLDTLPLTTVSYQVYGTIHLWWLLLLCNDIQNSLKLLTPGSVIKVIKKEYLSTILKSLKNRE
jgi:hypothetical protein